MMDTGDNSATAEGLKRQKLALLLTIISLSALFSVLETAYASSWGSEKGLFILDSLSFNFCTLMWCTTDAQLHGLRVGGRLRLAILIITPIGFPVYAFQTRGRRGWPLFGKSILFLALLVAVSVGAGVVTESLGSSTG
jgi:hypothetical protein